MRAPRSTLALPVLVVLSILPACDEIDRARTRAMPADTVATTAGSGLMLGLQVPGALGGGDEGVVRLTITNRSDTIASRIRLELIVPGWVEPSPPRPGDREVSMLALADGGTRFAYRMDETPLEPNQSETIEQRIRVPARGVVTDGSVPWSRVVRALLLGPDGEPLAEVESELSVDGAAAGDTVSTAATFDTGAQRDRLGSVRLGMSSTDLRQASAGVRDTTWMQEGMAQNVVIVPLGSNGRAYAVLDGDSVARIEVRDTLVRTRERLGVGSTMEQLRAAFGRACADAAEGTVVVWFPAAPGVSFALDTPVPQNVAQLRQATDQIPGSARVTRWWLRHGTDSCPG